MIPAAESHARLLASLMTTAEEHLFLCDHNGTVLYASTSIDRTFGIEPSELVGRAWRSGTLDPAIIARVEQAIDIVVGSGQSVRAEVSCAQADAEGGRDYEFSVSPVQGAGCAHAVIQLRDITERKTAKRLLEENEQLFRAIVRTAPIAAVIAGRQDGIIHYMSPYCEMLLGAPAARYLGESVRVLYHDPGDAYRLLRTFEREGEFENAEVRLKSAQSQPTFALNSARAVSYRSEPAMLFIYRDLTAHKRLAELANHDALTGLANRHLLQARLEQAIGEDALHTKPLALMFLDLDNFKCVNDTEGHFLGDELLKAVARRLRACASGRDILVRLGGDEFLFLMEDVNRPEDAAHMARRILDTLQQPFPLSEREYRVSASIGIALYPHDETEPGALLKAADAAMYRAKGLGKNRYEFFATMPAG